MYSFLSFTMFTPHCSLLGRQFYKCQRQSDGDSCNFFLWADDQATGTSSAQTSDSHMTSGGSHMTPGNSHMTFGRSHMASGDSLINPAPGFMMAPNRRGGRGGRASVGRRGEDAKGGRTAGKASVVVCNCGEEAVERTVQKDGPNKGRQFFVCPKPRDQQCQFFEWSSNLPEDSVRSSYSSSRRGRGGRNMRAGSSSWRSRGADDREDLDEGVARKKRAPPTCSVCREIGHTKRTCPLNQ